MYIQYLQDKIEWGIATTLSSNSLPSPRNAELKAK